MHSQYAVLIDAASGKILWGRNADSEREVASTTKMMTAILLLERGHLDDIVTAPNAVKGTPESSLHLTPGETLSLHDLLYAMLLRSANDTAITGAYYLSGSVPAFVRQMNLKAAELGCAHTHFVTPNGLYAPGHYSTAADLAKIAAYAVNNLPEFDTIVRTQKYQITRSMHIHDVWMRNTATTFLKQFPGADGIKTGYISQAGHCFVGSATRPDQSGRPWRLIAVVLDSNKCREDVESLLNYGFANFAPTLAVQKGAPLGAVDLKTASEPVATRAGSDIYAVESRWHPTPAFQMRLASLAAPPQAPFSAGTNVGTVEVLVNGNIQATGVAVSADDAGLKPSIAILKTGKSVGRDALRLLGGLFGLLCFLALARGIYRHEAIKARTRRRLARQSRIG